MSDGTDIEIEVAELDTERMPDMAELREWAERAIRQASVRSHCSYRKWASDRLDGGLVDTGRLRDGSRGGD